MIERNGVTVETPMFSDDDIPYLPCYAGDIVEVPSTRREGYWYLLKIPTGRERSRIDNKRNYIARMRRVDRQGELVPLMKKHQAELAARVGKPDELASIIRHMEDGTPFPTELIPIVVEYDDAGAAISPEIAAIHEQQIEAVYDYNCILVESLLYGLQVEQDGEKKIYPLGQAQVKKAIEHMELDFPSVLLRAQEVYTLPDEAKKN